MLIADALDVRHRLPRLWDRLRAGQVPVGYARHVAQRTRELDEAAAGYVDAEVAEYADGRICWSRFEALVAGKVIDADPDAAAAAERHAAMQQFAKVGRTNDRGHKSLYVRSTAAAMIRIDATIAYLADALRALGDDNDEDTRRATAVLIMANPTQAIQLLAAFAHRRRNATRDQPDQTQPVSAADDLPLSDTDDPDSPDRDGDGDGSAAGPTGQFCAPFRPGDHLSGDHPPGEAAAPPDGFGFDPRDLLPQVTLYLHLCEDALTRDVGGVVRWEGEGPVSSHYLRDVLGPACVFTVKPVIIPTGNAPVDGYEIPARHREAVHLLNPADIFPFAANTHHPPRPATTTRPHPPLRPTRPRRTTRTDRCCQPRPDDPLAPPDQDLRRLAAQATLRRDLPLARPSWWYLPRRQHRHPPARHDRTDRRPDTRHHRRRLPRSPRPPTRR